jgi:tRNA G10  N-methylase Trm11
MQQFNSITLKAKRNICGKIRPYFYVINYPLDEENLCKTEMKYLFNKIPIKKHFFSYHYINPIRSPFIKFSICIIFTGNSLEDIVAKIIRNSLSQENFKVHYVNYGEENLSYKERRRVEHLIGVNINGEAELNNPEILFGITKVNERWIFGTYQIGKASWIEHNRKPYYYSNALDVKAARALVNIAVSNKLNYSVIDPCCGIGTVVIEALSLGINIKGYEINPMIAKNAKMNLEYFEYKDVIINGDMHSIQDKFDVSIADLPYGLFSTTTLKEQLDIIKTCRRISNKMIIITFENMDEHLTACGFHILDRCYVCKGKFKRYITICN